MNLAKRKNIERELGVCLEIINLESKKQIFNVNTINKIYLNTELSDTRFFPKTRQIKTYEYENIGEKWNIRITLSRALISKIITDLVR